MTLLTAVVPSYNAQVYMSRAIDSLLAGARRMEIVIVDDGSTDNTGAIADEYAAQFPDIVKVIHKPNGGHGSAVNAGLEVAKGKYLKVVDSDDWVDPYAYEVLFDTLQEWEEDGSQADLVITNFVYEKEGKHRKQAERYNSAMPANRLFGWGEVRKFRPWQYMLMHSMLYRTEVLREAGLRLPEHSFYVDNIFAFSPLNKVDSLYYLDIDLYRYHVGREDQSVNERVMISRIDQQININKMMFQALSDDLRSGSIPSGLARYMRHYLGTITLVTSVLCSIDKSPELLEKKAALWDWMARRDPALEASLRRGVIGWFSTLRGPLGMAVTKTGYRVAKAVIGFN